MGRFEHWRNNFHIVTLSVDYWEIDMSALRMNDARFPCELEVPHSVRRNSLSANEIRLHAMKARVP